MSEPTPHPGVTTCEQFNRDVAATMGAHRRQVERLKRKRDALMKALVWAHERIAPHVRIGIRCYVCEVLQEASDE